MLSFSTVRQRLSAAAVGLGLVENIAPLEMPVSNPTLAAMAQEFVDTPSGSTLTLASGMAGRVQVRNNGAVAHETLVPTDAAGFPVGAWVIIRKGSGAGAGTVRGETTAVRILQPDSGGYVTLDGSGYDVINLPSGAWVKLQKIASPANTWRLIDAFGFSPPGGNSGPSNAVKYGTGAPTGDNLTGMYVRTDAPYENVTYLSGVRVGVTYTLATLPTATAAMLGNVVKVIDTAWGLDTEMRVTTRDGGYYWMPTSGEMVLRKFTRATATSVASTEVSIVTDTLPGVFMPGSTLTVKSLITIASAGGATTVALRTNSSAGILSYSATANALWSQPWRQIFFRSLAGTNNWVASAAGSNGEMQTGSASAAQIRTQDVTSGLEISYRVTLATASIEVASEWREYRITY